MTGHGDSAVDNTDLSVRVEIRTVNSRFAKVTLRCGEQYQSLEPRIEEFIRKRIRRGTVQVNIRVTRQSLDTNINVNEKTLRAYADAIKKLSPENNQIQYEQLLTLPGVVEESSFDMKCIDEDWPMIQAAVEEALQNLQSMRASEGDSLKADLSENCSALDSLVKQIDQLTPTVIENYQNRLREKLTGMLEETGREFDPVDIIREVGIFADRCDISEELVRLRSHVDQFRSVMEDNESQGRKLDFLTQEMFREANTIGSKANDATIAQQVVGMKTVIERIREMVQNIE